MMDYQTMKYFIVFCFSLFLHFSANAAYPQTKAPMPNFFDGFAKSTPYPESVYHTEYGDEIVLMKSHFHGSGLYINGSINRSVLDLVEGILEFQTISYVFLNSNGGYVDEGLALGRIFRERKIFTALDYSTECHSACFLAFLGGIERYQSGADLLAKHPLITTHTPYYLKSGRKIYLNRNEDLAKEVCNYIKLMLPEQGGKRACFETFSAKEGVVHLNSLMHKMGVFTGYLQNYGVKFVDSYVPPDTSRWYEACFNSADDFRYSDGSCERESKKCPDRYNLYSPETIQCMNKSGYAKYTADLATLSPVGGFIIRIQKKWEILGKPRLQ